MLGEKFFNASDAARQILNRFLVGKVPHAEQPEDRIVVRILDLVVQIVCPPDINLPPWLSGHRSLTRCFVACLVGYISGKENRKIRLQDEKILTFAKMTCGVGLVLVYVGLLSKAAGRGAPSIRQGGRFCAHIHFHH